MCLLVIVLFNSFVSFSIITNHCTLEALRLLDLNFPCLDFDGFLTWYKCGAFLGLFEVNFITRPICEEALCQAWFWNISRIQLMFSFNFINGVPMWPLVASYNPWLTFLVLLSFWLWQSFEMALDQSQWVKHSID